MSKPPPPIDADGRLKAFFRQTLASEPGVDPALATHLADRCVQSIEHVLTRHAATGAASGPVDPPEPRKPAVPAFDPYAFSAVTVLARTGQQGLLKRLAEIAEPDHLRAFAAAQHIAIDHTLTAPDDLRIAILRGTERRIAARRAAAS